MENTPYYIKTRGEITCYKYLAVCVDHKSGAQTEVVSHFLTVSHSL